MWINKEVDLPETLVSAHRAGRLVIFAGAGISMGAPSNLPDFSRLADLISGGTLTRTPDEPLDLFLGKLQSKPVDVQARARTFIGDPASTPSPIHAALVDLFPSADAVRIVTTNFDSHLTTAVRTRHPATDIFYAPALPLGRDFSGLVYLHGSIARRERLILSDGDFGQAYLSDGWATRFLMEMFVHHTVLFVGYSHQDVVMRYLARSFVGATDRFALTTAGRETFWAHLGITPVHFPERTVGDRYGALADAITAWATNSKWGLLEHEARIQEIVSAPPPLEPDVADYIRTAFENDDTLRFFVAHAKTPEWLLWVEAQKGFDALFSVADLPNQRSHQIAWWFAERFVLDQGQAAIDLIQRHGLTLHPTLLYAIARKLAYFSGEIAPALLGAWAAILTASEGSPKPHARLLAQLLKRCTVPALRDASIVLLSWLTRPRLKLDARWPSIDPSDRLVVRSDVQLAADRRELEEAWNTAIKPSLNEFYALLWPILTSQLLTAHELLRATRATDSGYDPLSAARSAIEPHEQDSHKDEWIVLIDMTRDVLEWMLEHVPTDATRLIDHWLNSESLLLQRLGIHGLRVDSLRDAAEALTLVRERHWLFALPFKHEIFRLLATRFPAADATQQQALIDSVLSEPVLETNDDDDRRISDYERYNLLQWLTTAAPESVARTVLESFAAAHPDFRPREHPDLDHWISAGFVEHRSPWSAADLLHQPLTDGQVRVLLDYKSPDDFGLKGPTRHGLDLEIEKAASQSFDWSHKLAAWLEQQQQWTTSLWGALIAAWKATANQLTPEQREAVLGILERGPLPEQVGYSPVPDLLDALVNDQTKESDLERLDALGDRLLKSSDSEAVDDESDDWLFRAINHRAGKVAQMWLRTLSQRLKRVDNKPPSIPSAAANRFEAALLSTNLNGQLVRTILGSHVHFLFSVDRVWTSQKILPLFDWSHPLQASGMWQGFLTWGQWNPALFDEMLPYTLQSCEHLDGELRKEKEAFSGRLASVAAHLPGDPWHGGSWLFIFVNTVDAEARARWAQHFGAFLEALSEERLAAIWKGWLRDYWTDRTTGVPRPLDPKERQGMMMWLVALRPHFDEALPLIALTAPTKADHYTFYKIGHSSLPIAHPIDTGKLLVSVLKAAVEAEYSCDEIFDTALKTAAAGAEAADVVAIVEHLNRLGCEDAAKQLKAAME
jgi:hypothetical protein